MATPAEQMLTVYLQEYSQLKSEQTARIGFRDNLLYVTLAAQGAIFAFTLTNDSNTAITYYPLLVIPIVSLILGWAYLVNDDKISEIGRYMRTELNQKIIDCTKFKLEDSQDEEIKKQILGIKTQIKILKNRDSQKIDEETFEILTNFGWEVFHRSDRRRKRRKRTQFIVDEITFVFSGIMSLVTFWGLSQDSHWVLIILSIIEISLLIYLGVEIWIYADFDSGK